MEEIKETRKKVVEVPVTRYRFEAHIGDLHEDLSIEDGEVVHVGYWTSRRGGGSTKGKPDFEKKCRETIAFIVEHKPEELENMVNVLVEGPMKEYVKSLQNK